jgi:2-pyrone-4,6-dicarboxylate lactonase
VSEASFIHTILLPTWMRPAKVPKPQSTPAMMFSRPTTLARAISRDMPVIVDHYGMLPAARGVDDANFQALLKLVGDGHAHVKVSAPYRLSAQYPDYADVRALHDALVATNPERLMWGTDWPHPSIDASVMPDDGHLLDLLFDWTADAETLRRILVDTPERLFGG